MAFEWAMRTEEITDVDAITDALQNSWEPFAVYDGEVYFRSQFYSERTEKKSSVHEENYNRAGNEPDEGEV